MSKEEKLVGDEAILAESRKYTRRSFAVGAAAVAAAYGVYWGIDQSQQIGRIEEPLRHTLERNAAISRAVFGERGLAPTYPVEKSVPLRLNGNVGMLKDLVPESWRLQLVGVDGAERRPQFVKDVTAWEYRYAAKANIGEDHDVKSAPGSGPKGEGQPAAQTPAPKDGAAPSVSVEEKFKVMAASMTKKRYQGTGEAGPSASGLDRETPGLLLTIEDLLALPKVELVTEFKCIEGWSQVVHWGGVRLRDLIEAYPPAKVDGREPRYVYMETPDGDYYGGYDLQAARHPQSLLVTEMAGVPLTMEHGAPLRLHMPIKYGYKQLKRIGVIAYADVKPDDYWTKLGYDWYAGL